MPMLNTFVWLGTPAAALVRPPRNGPMPRQCISEKNFWSYSCAKAAAAVSRANARPIPTFSRIPNRRNLIVLPSPGAREHTSASTSRAIPSYLAFVSRRLRCNLADVRYGISLLHGRDRTNIEHHACGGRPSFGDGVSEVVRHVPDFHALLYIRAALDRGIKNPVPIADHRVDFGDPYGVLNGGRLAGQHFEVAHYVERSVGQRLNVVCFHGAGVARLHGNRRFAARARGTVEVTGGVGIRRAVVHDNNVVQPKGQHHVMSNGVLFLIAGLGPVAVGPQIFV